MLKGNLRSRRGLRSRLVDSPQNYPAIKPIREKALSLVDSCLKSENPKEYGSNRARACFPRAVIGINGNCREPCLVMLYTLRTRQHRCAYEWQQAFRQRNLSGTQLSGNHTNHSHAFRDVQRSARAIYNTLWRTPETFVRVG